MFVGELLPLNPFQGKYFSKAAETSPPLTGNTAITNNCISIYEQM